MTMKKASLILLRLVLFLAIVAGGIITYFYYTTAESSVPSVTLVANEKTINIQNYAWHTSVLNGLLYREFNKDFGDVQPDILTIDSVHLDITDPDGYDSTIKVYDEEDKMLFSGDETVYKDFTFPKNGVYNFKVVTTCPQTTGKESYGQFVFYMGCQVKTDPIVVTSATEVTQGDVLAIEIKNVPDGVIPTAKAELGMAVFTTIDEKCIAFVPVGYLRETGNYTVLVSCGSFSKKVEIEVVEGQFEKQYLTIDTSNPVITAASSSGAYTQFRNTIYPFYETADAKTYWDGKFLQPVQ
ncbi:MAG: hypothetical protein WAX04_11930, partial [Oscillospiraceae bacterium]